MGFGSHRMLLAASAVCLLSGCIREKLPACTTRHEIYIRVAPAEIGGAEDLSAAGVDTATLFVFDDRNVLREMTGIDGDALAGDAPVEIRYCGTCHPKAVVWGNLETSAASVPVVGQTHLEDLRLTMRTDGEYAAVPDNLYYGSRELTDDRVQYILIRPAMGRLAITVRGLVPQAGERYFFLVETQIGGYDFRRTPLPECRVLRLDAARRGTSGDLTSGEAVPLFVYPEEHDGIEPLHVSLYRLRSDGAHLVGQTDIDDKALEIVPRAGQCVNVMMDFRGTGGVDIAIRVTDWDVVEQWEDW